MDGADGGVGQPRAGEAEGKDGEVDMKGGKCMGGKARSCRVGSLGVC